MERGLLNVAAVPTPSTPPAAPLPAMVVTRPTSVVTVRILLLPESDTYSKPPSGLSAQVDGQLNDADAPRPSAAPTTPLPASVLVPPTGSQITRTLCAALSTTKMRPSSGVAAMPKGQKKEALVRTPLMDAPTPLPASVHTVPLVAIARILWPAESEK
jgi:hypothetical protein